jgi:hypothetical protein
MTIPSRPNLDKSLLVALLICCRHTAFRRIDDLFHRYRPPDSQHPKIGTFLIYPSPA